MAGKSEETRRTILESAREVFIDDGFDGASMRKVAQRAGITHGTIYLHFRDKDDLFHQVSEEQFRVLLEKLRALPRTLDPLVRLTAALRTFAQYGLEYPNHYELMFSALPPDRARLAPQRFGPMAEDVYAYLYEALIRARDRRLLAARDPHIDTFALIAGVHGVVEMYRAAVTSADEALVVAERVVDLLLAGLSDRSQIQAAFDEIATPS